MSSGNKRGGNSGGPSQPKKPKNDEDDDAPGSFADHLADLDGLDEEFDTDIPMPESKGPVLKSTYDQWARPAPPNLNPALDSLSFQQVELDHYIGRPVSGMPGANAGPVPVVRMFGVTK